MHIGRHFGLAIITVWFSLSAVCSSAAAPLKAKATQPSKAGQVTVFYPKPAYDNELVRALRAAIDVTIDGQKVGTVDVGKPLTVTVPAGAHKLHVQHNGAFDVQLRRLETTVNVSSAKTSYFYIYHSFAGPQTGEVDATTAQAEMSGMAPKAPSGTATVFLYWQPALLELGFLKSDYDFLVDGKRIGTMTSGDYITAKVPAGRHVLTMDGGSIFDAGLRQELILGAGMTHYYVILKNKYMEFYELSAEQLGPGLKGLRLR